MDFNGGKQPLLVDPVSRVPEFVLLEILYIDVGYPVFELISPLHTRTVADDGVSFDVVPVGKPETDILVEQVEVDRREFGGVDEETHCPLLNDRLLHLFENLFELRFGEFAADLVPEDFATTLSKRS